MTYPIEYHKDTYDCVYTNILLDIYIYIYYGLMVNIVGTYIILQYPEVKRIQWPTTDGDKN
jgi:hypothetical protein